MKNNEELKKRVVEALEAHPYRYFKAKELARHLKLPPRIYKYFKSLLYEMYQNEEIIKHKRNRYCAPKPSSVASGKLHVKPRGYGFLLTPEGEEDVFINMRNMGIALDGDTVKVQLFARKEGARAEGRVVEVIERGRKHIVGQLKKGKHYYFLVPDDQRISRDIFVYKEGLSGAKHGQIVAVEIDNWEDELLNPEGHVAKILGFPDEAGVDVNSIIASRNMPLGFDEKVEKEAAAKKFRVTKKLLENRLDLRDQICFTIDPPDAKDFDDALSLRRLDNGNLEVGVHIADVSYFVDEDGLVDKEAMQRATSVYLVDRVIPMLPEHLSNELCSLKPNSNRLTFSCIMEMTEEGERVNYKIAESVIKSKRRFTYEDVQAFFDGEQKLTPQLAEPLTDLRALAKKLKAQRHDEGSLQFETPEPKISLDENGAPIDITRRKTLESMNLVEEFMLLANKTVAQHIDSQRTDADESLPFLYRIHEKPTREKMSSLTDLLSGLGYAIDLSSRISSKKLSMFLQEVSDTDEKDIINRVTLRSLMKAKYDTTCLGHFGLAFRHYTHFTSPIRRYPDLIVHRLLKKYAANDADHFDKAAMLEKLDAIATQANEQELVALDAERTSVKMKQVQFMENKVGEEFDAVISGVVEFGFFVELNDFLIEGLVHISDLHDDFYTFDEKLFTLEGTTTGQRFRLGDQVRVRLVRVDKEERVIDFLFEKQYAKHRPKPAAVTDTSKASPNGAQKSKPSANKRKRQHSPNTGAQDGKRDSSKSQGQGEVRERSNVRRPLTRGDDDRVYFTTLRDGRRRGKNTGARKGGPSRKQNTSNTRSHNNQSSGRKKPRVRNIGGHNKRTR